MLAVKMNAHFPWRSKAGGPEPEVWFHDIFRRLGAKDDTYSLAGAWRSPPTPLGARRAVKKAFHKSSRT